MNQPVVMVDVDESNVDAMDKVDLQVESTPGVYTVDMLYVEYSGLLVCIYTKASPLQTSALHLINDPSIYLTHSGHML